MTQNLKDIVREAQANQEDTCAEDEAEESGKSTDEIQDKSEQELENTVNITPPSKYTNEIVDLKKISCTNCKERFIKKQFLGLHIRYKHEGQKDNDFTLVFEETREDQSKLECDQCSFSSKYLMNLNRHHEQMHKKRKTKENINSVNKRTKPVKGFSCNLCEYKCVTKFNHNHHINRMH